MLSWTAWALLSAVLAGGPDEAAAAPKGAALDVVGACPDRVAVDRLLAGLLPEDGLRDVAASIHDRGPWYHVAAGGRAATFDDPARDCAARARQAAVFVAEGRGPHPRVLGPPLWTIEKGLVFDVAPGTTGPAWSPGAEIRGAFGSGAWSLVGAAGAHGPATLSFEGGWTAELIRLPLDAGARLTLQGSRFRPWLVAGGSLVPTAILGENVVQADRQWRMDLGTLLMAGATLRVFRRVGVAAALNLRWQPRPYHLQVAPHGTVGETPTWWLGLSLNYTLDGEASSP